VQYRTLGNSGAVVSSYALGTMTFGAEATEETSHAILDHVLSTDQSENAITPMV
jgi:aryl-alcohol dehydrogenase-like predicted oxidoreductase